MKDLPIHNWPNEDGEEHAQVARNIEQAEEGGGGGGAEILVIHLPF